MHPASQRARLILRSYLEEVVGRYHGRQLTERELEAAIREFPNDDLVPPDGVLLGARQAGRMLGCVGLRFLADGVGEVTRVFVDRSARGTGLGARLMHEVEVRARESEALELRLHTRRDLVEAQRLFARLGYEEAAPFNDDPYADLWFRKRLAPRDANSC